MIFPDFVQAGRKVRVLSTKKSIHRTKKHPRLKVLVQSQQAEHCRRLEGGFEPSPCWKSRDPFVMGSICLKKKKQKGWAASVQKA